MTHVSQVLESIASTHHQGEHGKEYEVDIDVSRVPINTEFLIVIEATYWNSFQNPSEEDASTYTDTDIAKMEELALFVLFPESRPFKDVSRIDAPQNQQFQPFHDSERFYEDEQRRFFYWSILDRKPNHHYMAKWRW